MITAPSASSYFTSADNAKLAFELWREAPPPSAPQPSTAAATLGTFFASAQTQAVAASKDPSVNAAAWIWVNRALGTNRHEKPNPLAGAPIHLSNGLEARTEFTTIAKADAATTVQALFAAGAPLSALASIAQAAGYNPSTDIVTAAQAKATAQTLFSGMASDGSHFAVARDKIILPDASIRTAAKPWGVMLDYETADGRGASGTLNFLVGQGHTGLISRLHSYGMKVGIFTDPLDSPLMGSTGFTKANLNQILSAVDRFSFVTSSGSYSSSVASSLDSQIALFKGPSGTLPVNLSKLVLAYDVGNGSISEAKQVHDYIMANHLAGGMVWMNGAQCSSAGLLSANLEVAALAGITGKPWQVGVTLETPSRPNLAATSDSGSSVTDNITNAAHPVFNGISSPSAWVHLFDGGSTVIGTTQADANGHWSVASGLLSEGVHSISAQAFDASGDVSVMSMPQDVTIDRTAPVAPNAPTYSSGALSGLTEASALVKISDGTSFLGQTIADALGHWSFAASRLAGGTHHISATATDLAGNTSAASADTTVLIQAAAQQSFGSVGSLSLAASHPASTVVPVLAVAGHA